MQPTTPVSITAIQMVSKKSFMVFPFIIKFMGVCLLMFKAAETIM